MYFIMVFKGMNTLNCKMVKISYAICVCNEHREIESLVNFLLKVKDTEDEINILVDSGKVTPEVRAVLESYGDKVVLNEREFDGKFAEHRNYHATKCSGDYIFAIDADEMPQEALIMNIKSFDGDIMYVPRINICPGYTAEWLDQHKFTLMKWDGLTFQIIKGATIRIMAPSNGKVISMRSLLGVKRLLALTLSPLCPSFTSRLWSAKTNKGSSTTLCNLI